MQSRYFNSFVFQILCQTFMEILLISHSYDVFRLLKFSEIEKRTRSMKLVHLSVQKISTCKYIESAWKQ